MSGVEYDMPPPASFFQRILPVLLSRATTNCTSVPSQLSSSKS